VGIEVLPGKPGGGGCVCMAYRNSSLAVPGRIAYMRGLCDSEPEGERVDQTSAYVGTVRLFEAHGFERVLQTTGRSGGKPRWLLRREFA
jgi:hypothetical protein